MIFHHNKMYRKGQLNKWRISSSPLMIITEFNTG